MSNSETLTLDQIGVPQELRDRAKIMWILTALWGPFGWGVCNFVWKVPGQEDDAWFQRQLEQAMFVGIAGWVGYAACGLGWLVHVGLGALGFLAINKGEDYSAPMIAGYVDGKKNAGSDGDAVAGAGQPAAPTSHTPPASSPDLLEPIESVAYQTWAWAWGHISQGHPVDAIIGRVQIDRARWDRVHPVFMQRMAQDRTHTIMNEFRKYAGTPAQPVQQQQAPVQQHQQVPVQQHQQAPVQQHTPVHQQQAPVQQQAPAQPRASSPEPAPIERWVEVSVALELGQNKGWDSAQLLANFGMSDHDWAGINAWWSQKFRASAHDKALQARYTQLQDYYTGYYGSR